MIVNNLISLETGFLVDKTNGDVYSLTNGFLINTKNQDRYNVQSDYLINVQTGELQFFNSSVFDSWSQYWAKQYSDAQIQALIDDGYIPIASPVDLNNVRTVFSGGSTKVFASGTKWQTAAINTLGIGDKYVQVNDINLEFCDSSKLVAYNAALAYPVGSVVSNTSRIYYCHVAAGVGVAPTGNDNSNANWLYLAAASTFANGWPMIGTADFTGIYNGGFYWIDNFYQRRSLTYSGLIRSANGGGVIIENVLMSNIDLIMTGTNVYYAMPLCSFVTAGAKIRKCYTNGRVEGAYDAGGLSFCHADGIMEECISDCRVITRISNASIIGRMNNSPASDCLARGVVMTIDANSGALIAGVHTDGMLRNVGIGVSIQPLTRAWPDMSMHTGAFTTATGLWDGELMRKTRSTGGTGLVKCKTNELKNLDLPSGWDATKWWFKKGSYPMLQWAGGLIPNFGSPLSFEATGVTKRKVVLEWEAPNNKITRFRLYRVDMVAGAITEILVKDGSDFNKSGEYYTYEDTRVDDRPDGWYAYFVRGVGTHLGRIFETGPSSPVIFQERATNLQLSESLFVLGFDDGHKFNDTILVPLLVEMGEKCTIFLCKAFQDTGGGGASMLWSEAKTCYDAGMDMQCHFSDHVDMAALFTASGETAISNGLEAVNDGYVNAGMPIPKQMAYPLGTRNNGSAGVVRRYRQTGRSLTNYQYSPVQRNTEKFQAFDISGTFDRKDSAVSGGAGEGWDDILYRLRQAKCERIGVTFYGHQVVDYIGQETSINRMLSSYLRELILLAQRIGIKIITHDEFNDYLDNSFEFDVVIPSDAFTFGNTTPATNDFVIIVEDGKDFTINWGDTNVTSSTGTGSEQRFEHEYATAGTYAVNISYLGNELKHFQVEQAGLNVAFDLEDVPHGIETLIINGANTVSGDMKTLAKTTLKKIVIGGANTVSGDFNKIPYYVTHFDVQGLSEMGDYSGTSVAKFPMDGLNTLISIPDDNGLIEADIDSLINDLADVTWDGSNKTLTLTGDHAVPSAASADAIADLILQGVDVNVNS